MSAKKIIQKIKDDQAQGAARGFLEDLFDDYYAQRYKVYWMNFIRGIVFGLGSVIGGTVVIALMLWLLSFSSELPFVGRFSEQIQHSIQVGQDK